MAEIKHRYTDFNKDYLPAAQFKLKHKNYFNWADFYDMLHEWVVEEGYASRKGDTKFPEQFFLQRETQKAGKEVWVYWRLQKKINAVFSYDLDIDIHIIGMRNDEVIVKGKKYKTNWGELEFKVWSKCIFDRGNAWGKHPLLSKVKKLFQKRIMKTHFENHKRQLYRESYRLQEFVKNYFRLATYLPEAEAQHFYPQREKPD